MSNALALRAFTASYVQHVLDDLLHICCKTPLLGIVYLLLLLQAQQAVIAAQHAAAAAPAKPVEGYVPTRVISDIFCAQGEAELIAFRIVLSSICLSIWTGM